MSDKERAMTNWVYRCRGCGITFAIEVAEGEEPPLTAACPQCGNTEAEKQFELPQNSGCGCGGGCC